MMHLRSRRNNSDILARTVIVLLCACAVWSLGIAAALTSRGRLPSAAAAELPSDSTAFLHIIVSRDDRGMLRASALAPRTGDDVRLHRAILGGSPDARDLLSGANRREQRRLMHLIHAFGYSDLPLLIVLDQGGRVLRVRSIDTRAGDESLRFPR